MNVQGTSDVKRVRKKHGGAGEKKEGTPKEKASLADLTT
jgi:hypothetical protein